MKRRLVRLFRTIFPKQSDAEYFNDQGVDLAEQGRHQSAVASFESALDANPRLGEAWSNLASCLDLLGQPKDACDAYAKAEDCGYQSAYLYDNWGNALSHQGRLSEAEQRYRVALDLDSTLAEAKANLGLTLISMGRIEEGQSLTAEAWAGTPKDQAIASLALCAAQLSANLNSQQLYAGHSRWPAIQGQGIPQYRNVRDPERKLRVGYISSDFRYHSCACFLLPLFKAHDRKTFEVIAYFNATTSDAITQEFKDSAAHWRDCHSLGDDELAHRILMDEIDLLVDCSGHTKGNRLGIFQLKPAPIQITWLGYPSTTGLNAINYRISDHVVDPQGEADQLHSETVLRLNSGFHTYRPLTQTPDPSPAPSLRTDRIHFGAFQNLSKVSDKTIELWAMILDAVPNSRLIMKARGLDERAVVALTRKRMADFGIAENQFEFIPWNAVYGQHFRDYERVDIALDTTPYNGTTTTCEALWMGVPVITLSGDRSAGRVGASLLTQLGHKEWIARSEAEFVHIAVSLASDTARLARLRKEIRRELCQSPLGEAGLFVRSLENTYRKVWRHWCATSSTQ